MRDCAALIELCGPAPAHPVRRPAYITPGGGVLPYMGYIGMRGPKGYSFSALFVINRVSILAILPPFWSYIKYRVFHSSLQFGLF